MTDDLSRLLALWKQNWVEALRLWSPYLRLREPLFLGTMEQEREQGLTGSFAMIRFLDTQVVISLRQVQEQGLEDYGVTVLAHEIGHHIYAPGDLTEHGRMLGRMRRMLPGFAARAPEVANLYTDLFINHRLKVRHSLPFEEIYQKFAGTMSESRLYLWYLRIYESLWSLPKGSLARQGLTPEEEGDAILAGRIIRRFADHPVEAAGRFAALALSRLEADAKAQQGAPLPWMDSQKAAEGCEIPDGLIFDDSQDSDSLHPSLDPFLSDLSPADSGTENPPSAPDATSQRREPDQYVELLREMGLPISEEDAAMRYYKELATPLLIPFPRKSRPPSLETHPEGLDTWDIGRPLDKIDWLETLMRGPAVIPGFTAVERLEGQSPGPEQPSSPLHLDLYVDSSGSIPNPRSAFSPLCLAGAVMALSALRAGARVRAILWSGAGQVRSTLGFTRDSREIFRILTGYFGGGTAFPLSNLVASYKKPVGPNRLPPGERVHLMVISDEGVDTMLTPSGQHPDPRVDVARALASAAGGGSLVLNIGQDAWLSSPDALALSGLGFSLYRVKSWEDMVEFSRQFSRKTWSAEG